MIMIWMITKSHSQIIYTLFFNGLKFVLGLEIQHKILQLELQHNYRTKFQSN